MSILTSRVEDILQSTIDDTVLAIKPRSRVEVLLTELKEKIDEILSATNWIGITTTVLVDGSSTNPITINNEQVTAKAGDITSYNDSEFIFNGSVWQEFGSSSHPYDSDPVMNGVASAGSSNAWSRGDHVHPSDTSRQEKVKTGTISLTTTWSGNDPYSQVVTVSGATITANSKITLQLTSSQIEQLISDGVSAMTVENNNGVLTCYSFSASPSISLTISCVVMEV